MDRLVAEAIHNTALFSDAPAKRLADRMHLSHETFLNKANPKTPGNQFTAAQLCDLVKFSGSEEIPSAFRQLARGTSSTPDLLAAVLAAGMAQGDVRRVMLEALEDGKICQRERKDIVKEINDVRAALDLLESSVNEAAEVVSL